MDWLSFILEILFLVGEILFEGMRSQPVGDRDMETRKSENTEISDKTSLFSLVIVPDTKKSAYEEITPQFTAPSKFSLSQQVIVTKKTHPKYGQTGEVIHSPRQSREGRWLVDVQFGDRTMTFLDSDLGLSTTR